MKIDIPDDAVDEIVYEWLRVNIEMAKDQPGDEFLQELGKKCKELRNLNWPT